MVDLWVMNDLADNKKLAIFENLAGSISKIDRALDPIAKAELFRQAHRGIAHGNDSTGAAHLLDNVAPIMRFDLLLHRGHYIRRAEVHFLPRGCAAGNQIRAHEEMRQTPHPLLCPNKPNITIGTAVIDCRYSRVATVAALCERRNSPMRLLLQQRSARLFKRGV